MRDIKFRVWKDYSAQMEFFDIEDLFDFTPSDKQRLMDSNSSNPMQYTELKDKNGVEIYEGDIVECWDSCGLEDTSSFISGAVSFNGGCFCIKHSNGHYNKLALTCAENVEVIGNIHENPELLEQE